jgi:hypothetical protein
MKKTLLVNLFGGPGTGKSTMMAHLFSELKFQNIDCEMAPEYAKEIVWEESHKRFDSQLLIMGEQFHRINRLYGKVDVIITDAPLLNFLLFIDPSLPTYQKLVVEEANKFNHINIFLKRVKPYNSNGRYQSEDEAKDMDKKLAEVLSDKDISFYSYESSKTGALPLLELIKSKI